MKNPRASLSADPGMKSCSTVYGAANAHEIKRYGQLNACINWLRGLAINVDFYYRDIVKRLAEWLDDTEENQWKYIDSQGDDLYWLLIAREIIASK